MIYPNVAPDRKIKAILKVDGTYDLKLMIDNVLNKIEPIYKSCLNCEKFDEKQEICKHMNCNQRPPARVIAYGCPQWEDYDEIPF